MLRWLFNPETLNPTPYPQRTHILRLLGPKTLFYKAFGAIFDAKGTGCTLKKSIPWGAL